MDVNGDHILITDVDLGSLQIVSPGKGRSVREVRYIRRLTERQ